MQLAHPVYVFIDIYINIYIYEEGVCVACVHSMRLRIYSA